MERSLQEQQYEALHTAGDYILKLINGINMCIINIKENKQEEARDLLSYIAEGIEWLNEVVQLTKDIQTESIDEEIMKTYLEKIYEHVNEENYDKVLNILHEKVLRVLDTWQYVISKSIVS